MIGENRFLENKLPIAMNDDIKSVRVSEHFYSLQGEGNTVGKPSVFLRLTGCNLMCGGHGTEKDGELHNRATWRCDTIEVWLHGEMYRVEKLATILVQKYKRHFENGAQLVITGGEPMLRQKQIKFLLPELVKRLDFMPRVEVETNCTIPVEPECDLFISQYNVSPKLKNSGMAREKRFKPEVIKEMVLRAKLGDAIFKFVVQDMLHIREAERDFIVPFEIPTHCVWMMPGCENQQQLTKLAPTVAAHAMEMGYNFSTRLQIGIWNQTVGV